jgi:hypothetical protein
MFELVEYPTTSHHLGFVTDCAVSLRVDTAWIPVIEAKIMCHCKHATKLPISGFHPSTEDCYNSTTASSSASGSVIREFGCTSLKSRDKKR